MSENIKILELLKTKSSTKQEVFRVTQSVFSELSDILKKKSIILITKKDIHQDKIDVKALPKGIKKHFISSITGDQTDNALADISDLLEG